MIEITARDLPALIHDQDVVAELLRLRQNLRRQDDRAALRGLFVQKRDDRTLQDRIHAGRELVEKDNRHVDHEHLGDLDAPADAAAQVLHFRGGHVLEAEARHDFVGAGAHRSPGLAMKPRERQQVVLHAQKELGGLLLDHDPDVPPHLERLSNDVEAEDADLSRGWPHERHQHAQRGRLAGAVRTEQPEDRPAAHLEAEPIDRADFAAAPGSIHLDELIDRDGDVAHDESVYEAAMRRTCSDVIP